MARNEAIFDSLPKVIYVVLLLFALPQLSAADSDKRAKHLTSPKDSQQSANLSGGRSYNIDNDRSGHSARGSSNFANESESPALNTFLENVLKAQNELKWIDQAARRVNHDDRSRRFRGKRGFDEDSGTASLAQKRKYANGSSGVTPERVYLEKEMASKRNADWDDFDSVARFRHRLSGPVYEKGTMDDQPLKDWTSGEGSSRSMSNSLNPNRDFERGMDNRLGRWSPDYEAIRDADLSRGRDYAFSKNYARLNAREEREAQEADFKTLTSQDATFAKSKLDGTQLSLGSLEKMVLDLKKSLKDGQNTNEKSSDSSHGNLKKHDERRQSSNEENRFATRNIAGRSNWWSDPRPAEEIFDFKRRANDPEDRDASDLQQREWRRKRSEHANHGNEQDSTVHRENINSGEESDRKRRSSRSFLPTYSNRIPIIEAPHVDLEDIVDEKTRERIANAYSPKSTNSYTESSGNSSSLNAKVATVPEIFGMSAMNGRTDFSSESSANRTGKNELKGSKKEENSGERSLTLSQEISDSSANNSSRDRLRVGPEDNSAQSCELTHESSASGGWPMNTVGRERIRSKEDVRSKAEGKEANVGPNRRQEVIKVFQPQGHFREDSASTKAIGGRNVRVGQDEDKGRDEVEDRQRKLSQQVSRKEGVIVGASSPTSDAVTMKGRLRKSEEAGCRNETMASNDDSMREFDTQKRVMTQENMPSKVIATSVDLSVHQLRVTPSKENRQDEDLDKNLPCGQSKFSNETGIDEIDGTEEGTEGQKISAKTLNVEDSDEFFKGLSKLAKNLMIKESNRKQSSLIKTDNDLIPPRTEQRAWNWQSSEEEKSASNQREPPDRNLVHDPENKSGRNLDGSEMVHDIDTGSDAPDKSNFNSAEINSPGDKEIMKPMTRPNTERTNESVDKHFSGTLGNSADGRRSRYLNNRDGKYTNDLSNSRYDVSNHGERIESDSDYPHRSDTMKDKFQYSEDGNLKRVEGSTRKLLWSSAFSVENEDDNAVGRSDGDKDANEDSGGAENYVEEEEKAIVDESADRNARSLPSREMNPLKARVDMLIRQRMSSRDPGNRDYVRKRRYPLGTIEYYDYDSEVDGQDEKGSAISSEQNRANLDNASSRSAIKSDREKVRAAGGSNGSCKSDTLAGAKKNEQAEQAEKEERERAKLKNKVPKEEFIADLGQAQHTNSTGKTEKPSGFSETRSQYEGEKASDDEEEPRIIVQGEDAQSDLYRGRSQVDVKSILDASDQPEPRSLENLKKVAEHDGRILLDKRMEYEFTVHNKEEPMEVGDFVEDIRPLSLTGSKKDLEFARDAYDYEDPRRSDCHYRDIDGRHRNIRPLYEELKKVYDWSEDVRDRPRFRGDLRMRFEMDDNRESKNSAVPPAEPNLSSSNTSKSNYLALKTTDDLFKSGIEQSNSSDDKKTADEKSTPWRVMKVVPTKSSHARTMTGPQSSPEQRKYPEMDSSSPYANPKYIETIKLQDGSRNVGHAKQPSLETKDLHELFVDPVDWMDDLDDDVRVRLGRSLMAVGSPANRLPKTIENMQRPPDDSNENSLREIEAMESDLLSHLPESGLAKIRVKRRAIEDNLKQSAAKKYPTSGHVDVEEGIRLNQVQAKNANAERDLVHGKVERDMPSSEDVIEVSLNNAKNDESPDDETGKNINCKRERSSNYHAGSEMERLLDDGALRLKRGADDRTFYDDVNEGWRESSESKYNRYLADKRDIRFHPGMSGVYDQSYDQHFDGYFVPEWSEVPLYDNSTEQFDQNIYGKVARSISSKKGKSGKYTSKVAKKHVDGKQKKRKDRHHKRSPYDSEEYLKDDDWKLDEDDEIMNPFASEADGNFAKARNIIFESSIEPSRKTRKTDHEIQQKKLQSLLTVDNMEDESQMNVALHGELAGKIVENIFEQVQSNEALKIALGPGLYRKHKPEDAATVDKNYRQGLNQDEVKHTEAMMKRVMELLGRLVLDEVQRKTCASLPPDMNNFLHWMLGVDKGWEPLEEAPPLPHVRHEQTSERHPDDKFLFHGAMNNEPDLELTELYGKVRVLQDLVKEYNTLPEIEKEKVRTVYDYLERQINLLLEYIREKELKQAERNEMRSVEGAMGRNDNLLQYQSAVPKEFNERNITMPDSFSHIANMPDFFSLNNTSLTAEDKSLLDDTNESGQAKYRNVRSSDSRKGKKQRKRKRKHRKHRKNKDDFEHSKYRYMIHDANGFRRKRANLKENEWNPFESSHDRLLLDDNRKFVSKETDVLTDDNNQS